MSDFLIPPQSVFSTLRSPHRAKQLRRRGLRFERLEARAMLAGHRDFNGDGFDDLAVGVSGEDLGTIVDAGAVQVIYGGSKGLKMAGNQRWTQDSSGVNGIAAQNDEFGYALAIGDFNRDGFDDLAIGVPGEIVGGKAEAGAVNVLYGSKNGLTAKNDQLWTQDSAGINGSAEADDLFGTALATGDFDRDGFDDLAIGADSESMGAVAGAGAVNVIYGSVSGLTSAVDQFWTQDTSGINDKAEVDDHFGSVLTTGDFNHDGFDDLAVSVLQEDVGVINSAGGVNVIYGSPSGLNSSGDQFWTQDSTGVPDAPEESDFFGLRLAAGDFNGDSFDDLAIGVSGEDGSAGAVQVLNGSATKLTATSQFFNSGNLGFTPGSMFSFGFSLASGDFDRDGFDELAIGTPGETVGTIDGAGAVYAVYGTPGGLNAGGGLAPQRWHQGPGSFGNLSDSAEVDDRFGFALAIGDYDGDGRSDLAIGVPREDIPGTADTGGVQVLYAFHFGLFNLNNQFWHQGFLSSDGNEVGDRLGFSLA